MWKVLCSFSGKYNLLIMSNLTLHGRSKDPVEITMHLYQYFVSKQSVLPYNVTCCGRCFMFNKDSLPHAGPRYWNQGTALPH